MERFHENPKRILPQNGLGFEENYGSRLTVNSSVEHIDKDCSAESRIHGLGVDQADPIKEAVRWKSTGDLEQFNQSASVPAGIHGLVFNKTKG